ncbi:MAG: phosphodiester glycosidase family protein [Clostridia bacterium]|nr:phosphodiester glycosidase family protein [Clostridia bacterium]
MAKHAEPTSVTLHKILITLRWIGIGLGALIAVAVIGFFVFLYSPFFPKARAQYVMMTYHTSNPWLCTAFLPDKMLNRILEENRVEEPEGFTDPDLIQIVKPTTTTTGGTTAATTVATTVATAKPTTTVADTPRTTSGGYHITTIYEEEGMDVLQLTEKNYTARLIRVKDPSRVKLGLCKSFMVNGAYGEKLPDMCARLGATAGINAGGFVDVGGVGSGNFPTYLCVKDGEILYANPEQSTYNVIGFNEDNILVLGNFTKQQIIDNKIRDAVSFKPFLIVNGKRAGFYGISGGEDPRAAIGQTADGTVLLLTIDGRQAGMIGGNMRTVTDIMWEFGAVTAANLDGGSSTTMVINDKLVNKPCGPAGARFLPNGWMVY